VETGAGLPACEADSPECGIERLWAARQDDGYAVYALVRHGWQAGVWVVRVGGSLRETPLQSPAR